MRKKVQKKFEMITRALNFIRSHPSTDPSYGIVQARLEEARSRAEVIAARQHNGLGGAQGARALREVVRKDLQLLLHYLVAVGGVVAKDRSELAARFKLPHSNAGNLVFLTSAKALMEMAESQRDLLIAQGMSTLMLDDISKKVAEFEAASESARTARLDHIGARTDLEVVSAQMTELVRVMDGMNRYRYAKDPEALAEWNAAKDVPAVPVASKTTPKTGDTASAA